MNIDRQKFKESVDRGDHLHKSIMQMLNDCEIKDKEEGLILDNNSEKEKIKNFTMQCLCGSNNTTIECEFNYYGDYTGYDLSLQLICRDCDKTEWLNIG